MVKQNVTKKRLPFAGWRGCGEDGDCGECLDVVYSILNKDGEDLPAETVIHCSGTFNCLAQGLLSYLGKKIEEKPVKRRRTQTTQSTTKKES